MLIRYFNTEIQIVSLVNFTLLSQRSFVPSLASVTKSAVVGHFYVNSDSYELALLDRIYYTNIHFTCGAYILIECSRY